MRTLRQMLPLLVAIVALLLLFRIWVPMFLRPDNMLDLVQQISVNAIIAFGISRKLISSE